MSDNNDFTPEQLTQLNNLLDSRLDYNLSNITQEGKDMINSAYEATIKTRMDVNMSNVSTSGKTVVKNLAGESDTVKGIILGESLSPANYLKNETLNSKTLIIQPYTHLIYKPDNSIYFTDSKVSINVVSCLDTGTSLSVGTDYCVYLIKDSSGKFAFKVSKNSTAPSGYTTSTSTKIGGFHTECVNVGTISGHPLSGLTAGSILPASVWTQRHRPICSPKGMVYVSRIGKWVDIYLQSGTGTSTASAYNATHTVNRKWDLHADDMSMVGKGFLTDNEFGMAAEGSNCATAISGAADATTVGGHSDTAGRRMVSNDGIEEMCGYIWQWLACPSANGGSGWGTTTGGKGECYGSSYALFGGGSWGTSSSCGPWARDGDGRAYVGTSIGGRGCAPGLGVPFSWSSD